MLSSDWSVMNVKGFTGSVLPTQHLWAVAPMVVAMSWRRKQSNRRVSFL